MKTKKLFFMLVIAIIAILMLTVALGSVQAVDAAPKKVKVTWNANGGKIANAKTKVVSVKNGAKIVKLPNTPTYTGYTFKGWYTKKIGGIKVTKATKINKKVTHYAQWTAKKYIINFDANGGNVTTKSNKVTYKKDYGVLPTPTRAGYTFNGWYTDKTGGTKVSATTKMVAKNTVVYAQWKRVLTSPEKSLIGEWTMVSSSGVISYTFNNDGSFIESVLIKSSYSSDLFIYTTGLWYESGGTIYMYNKIVKQTKDEGKTWESLPNAKPTETMKYSVGTDEYGAYLADLKYGDLKYRKRS